MNIQLIARERPPQTMVHQILNATGDAEVLQARYIDQSRVSFAVFAYDADDPGKRCQSSALLLKLDPHWHILCGVWAHRSVRESAIRQKVIKSLLSRRKGLCILSPSTEGEVVKSEIAAGMHNIRCTTLPTVLRPWYPLTLLFLQGNPNAVLNHAHNKLRQVRMNQTAYERVNRPWTYPWRDIPPHT